jgi:hypothetical protein
MAPVKHTGDVLDHELTGQTLAKFHVANVTDFASDQTAMRVRARVIINGTTYTVIPAVSNSASDLPG